VSPTLLIDTVHVHDTIHVNARQKTIHDTVYIYPDREWQQGFDLTHNPDEDSVWHKPVSYYINNKRCAGLAIDFYNGEFRPSDNNATDQLLNYATTSNDTLRPFYRWCLNKTIEISDGALADHVGLPAKRYAEKFPKEFLHYMQADSTKSRYRNWVEAINYSGYYDHDSPNDYLTTRREFIGTMKRNCKGCNAKIFKLIEKFGVDCFPNESD
jgi:hypothetical protein